MEEVVQALKVEEGRRSETMLAPQEVQKMLALQALGWGSKRISRELGCSRNTVRAYLREGGWKPMDTSRRTKALSQHQEWLAERLKQHRGNADVVRQDLARELGLERALWDQVHAVLATDSHTRSVRTKIRSRTDALLRGLLYSPTGERMTPTFTSNRGQRYAYYISSSANRFGATGQTLERVPAAVVEAAVIDQIRGVLTSPVAIAAVVSHARQNPAMKRARLDEAAIVVAMSRLSQLWEQLFPVEQHRIANLMIQRVDLVDEGGVRGVRVKWHDVGWDELISEFTAQGIEAELAEAQEATA